MRESSNIMEREKERKRKKEGTQGNGQDESAVRGAAELIGHSRGHTLTE